MAKHIIIVYKLLYSMRTISVVEGGGNSVKTSEKTDRGNISKDNME